MTRREQAEKYFTDGYNCTQSVALAFSDLIPIDKQTLMKLCSSFGGGMGRLREVCGAVSGMFAVAGILYGYSEPTPGKAKAEHYGDIQYLAKEFENRTGSIICRELLNLGVKRDLPTPEARTNAYYEKRPCKEMVGVAAQILEEYINEKNHASN